MERPFEVGETIEVGSVSGEVKAVNWRSAHIEALGGAIQIVPNSTRNKETILNFSRPLPYRMELVDVGFSYQDPPYKVRAALLELLLQTEGVLKKPKPIVATLSYEEFRVKYRLVYRTTEQDRWTVKNELVTRIWYVAKRNGFTMPYRVNFALQPQSENHFDQSNRRRRLCGSVPASAEISHEDRSPHLRSLTFGAGEHLYDEGEDVDGVYSWCRVPCRYRWSKMAKRSRSQTIGGGEFWGKPGCMAIRRRTYARCPGGYEVVLIRRTGSDPV